MEYFLWNIDPVLLHLGPVQLRWYGLLFVGSFFAGAALLKWIYKREGKNPDQTDDLLIYLMIGAVIGARLAHTLFYEPQYYLSHPLEILYVWKGGLASHGGILGVIIASYIFCKKYDQSFAWLLSRLTVPGALAGAFIRIGNFFNSEIIGTKTDLPWAIIFQRYTDLSPRHPVQLYEALTYFTIFLILLFIYKRISFEKSTKILFGLFMTLLFASRFLLEFVKTKQESYASDGLLNTGQMLSVPFLILGALMLAWGLLAQVDKK